MKKLFFSFSLILLLAGCNKDEPTITYSTVYTNSEIKSLRFKPGTYWIYLSDSLNQRDSTYVGTTKEGLYAIDFGQNDIVSYEYYAMSCNTVYPVAKSIASEYFVETNHMLLNPVVAYPQAKGPVLYTYDTLKDWNGSSSHNRYLDSLTVGNKTFYKVQECKFSADTHAYVFYTTGDLGIIRKVITTNSVTRTWNLDRWNTVK